MPTIAVAPELNLDDTMYQRTLTALGQYAPDEVQSFTWERFIARDSWRLIPDVEHPEVPWFKAELIVKCRPPYEQTIKLNVWRSPDVRRSGVPMPHSHPWPFVSHLLMGGYAEDRYTVKRPDILLADPYSSCDVGLASVAQGVQRWAWGSNSLDLTTFHEVTEVLNPGRTVSLMICGPGRKEGWGYLNPETGLYTPTLQSPVDKRFKELLLDRNPHLRK